MWGFSVAFLVFLLTPTSAEAGPLVAAIGLFTKWFAAQGFFTQFAIRLAAAFILNRIAQLLAPKPRVPDQKRELQLPRSRPPKRFVYGRNRIYGSPAPWRVKGSVLYGCLILNSRPSAIGVYEIYMDKRRCRITAGDAFSFTGPGAVLGDIDDFPTFGELSSDNPRVWISRGERVSPPTVFTTEAPEFFAASDGWRGCTVMWVRLVAGPSETRSERWRATPPEFEVLADWSLVWDPRNLAQNPDNPATWLPSGNQALVLLDALRQNPIRRYPLSQIHLPSFIEAADVADQQVRRHYASLEAEDDVFERRYQANGVTIWTGGELVDQITPIVEAGAGELFRIGGRVGYAAGEYRPPMFTVTDFVEDGGLDYQVLRPGRELPVFVKGVYIAPDRDWQEAELKPLPVEGAADTGTGDEAVFELRMPYVTSPTQAMRVQQIMARKFAAQRTATLTLWPEAMDVVAGATVLLDLPPDFARLNGEWTVLDANPALWVSEMQDSESGGEGVALRIPVTLQANSSFIYEWVPETDEQVVFDAEFDPTRLPLEPPADLTVTTGAGVSSQTQARLRVNFTPTPNADRHEVFFRRTGENYALTATIFNGDTVLIGVAPNEVYDVRVRAVATPVGAPLRYSAFSEVTGITALFADSDLVPPTDGIAIGGDGQIAVSFTAPNSLAYRGTQFWRNTVDSTTGANLRTTLFGAAETTKTFTDTEVLDDVTYYYFARSVDAVGFTSDFTPSVSATTDPP